MSKIISWCWTIPCGHSRYESVNNLCCYSGLHVAGRQDVCLWFTLYYAVYSLMSPEFMITLDRGKRVFGCNMKAL